eukprot:TRINITY_DN8764_c1_g1_i2.p1 TRINITY_DN8764_c1_g1~~TRINITY_DN8764_c1_g1_i2.p1  ORF type:complete len:222 (+),score=35.65 TRINITY_DN8764_c1_g1_i2:110-775(+)
MASSMADRRLAPIENVYDSGDQDTLEDQAPARASTFAYVTYDHEVMQQSNNTSFGASQSCAEKVQDASSVEAQTATDAHARASSDLASEQQPAIADRDTLHDHQDELSDQQVSPRAPESWGDIEDSKQLPRILGRISASLEGHTGGPTGPTIANPPSNPSSSSVLLSEADEAAVAAARAARNAFMKRQVSRQGRWAACAAEKSERGALISLASFQVPISTM